jgi:hypothetical protein
MTVLLNPDVLEAGGVQTPPEVSVSPRIESALFDS